MLLTSYALCLTKLRYSEMCYYAYDFWALYIKILQHFSLSLTGNFMHSPLISIIMPAYNAAKFIRKTIESVLNQSYKNIELIVCNDSSSDNTVEIIKSFNDPRIVLINNDIQSGSAYIPREVAFNNSRGRYCILLDSDDFIEDNYVEKVYNRLISCDADMCCGLMILVNEEGVKLVNNNCIPEDSFDFSVIISGREAFFYTVPKWKIGLNGLIAKREVWERAFKKNFKQGRRGIHDDEVFSRYLLLYSKLVVFCKAKYFYTVNFDSVTHVFNKRIFDYMNAESDLLKLIEKDFGHNSSEYRAVECNDFFAYKHSFSNFISSISSINRNDFFYYFIEFSKWHSRLNWIELKKYLGITCYISHRFFKIEFVLFLIKKRKMSFFLFLLNGYIKYHFNYFNKYVKWYITRKKREKQITNQIIKRYSFNNPLTYKNFENNYVINIIDGSACSGGLADRIRGIISTYAVCKKNGLKYKLYFSFPFHLQDYLEPADYNWIIDAADICRDSKCCDIIVLDTTEESFYQFSKQQTFLEDKLIESNNKQKHVYTNAGFAYCLDFSSLFNELFKPSERLKSSLDKQKNILGSSYISVSARFLDLLGDFNEMFGYGTPLSDSDSQKLIADSLWQIEKLHSKYPNKRILVNSDSIKFLNASSKYDYTYSIPGTITHIDNNQNDDSYQRYEKTFLDFFMIANASKIFLLKGKLMHRSGYPYAASKIFNKEFNVIEY